MMILVAPGTDCLYTSQDRGLGGRETYGRILFTVFLPVFLFLIFLTFCLLPKHTLFDV
jgi:hypothetical protein